MEFLLRFLWTTRDLHHGNYRVILALVSRSFSLITALSSYVISQKDSMSTMPHLFFFCAENENFS